MIKFFYFIAIGTATAGMIGGISANNYKNKKKEFINNKQTKLQSYKKELNFLNDEKIKLEKNNQNLKKILINLIDEISKSRKEELISSIKRLNSEISDLQNITINKEESYLLEEIAALEIEVKEISSYIDSKNHEINESNSKINNLEQQISTKSSLKMTKDSEVGSLLLTKNNSESTYSLQATKTKNINDEKIKYSSLDQNLKAELSLKQKEKEDKIKEFNSKNEKYEIEKNKNQSYKEAQQKLNQCQALSAKNQRSQSKKTTTQPKFCISESQKLSSLANVTDQNLKITEAEKNLAHTNKTEAEKEYQKANLAYETNKTKISDFNKQFNLENHKLQELLEQKNQDKNKYDIALSHQSEMNEEKVNLERELQEEKNKKESLEKIKHTKENDINFKNNELSKKQKENENLKNYLKKIIQKQDKESKLINLYDLEEQKSKKETFITQQDKEIKSKKIKILEIQNLITQE